MKSTWLLLPLLVCCSLPAAAQAVDEWFRQKETQKKYLVQQIAALQAYAGTLRQGYQALGQGISTVQHIKDGDLGLHRVFFHSHRQLNPVIGQSAKLSDILYWQAAVLRDFEVSGQSYRGHLTADELQYVQQVKASVLQACARDMDGLWLLASSGGQRLSDAEALRQLAVLHQSMATHYRFSRHFMRETRLLALRRERETAEAKHLFPLYGIPR